MTVRLEKDTITPSIAKMKAALAQLPRLAFVQWVKITPIDKGNARRKTRLNQNTIDAAYPYAQRLDEGYSNQAPKGMSEPVKKFIEREMKKIMRL
jgi:hypothetical protein